MSFLQNYYLSVTKQLFTSKFIYKNDSEIYNLNKGSYSIEDKKSNFLHYMTLLELSNRKPTIVRTVAPIKTSSEVKRVKIFILLKGFRFNNILRKWIFLASKRIPAKKRICKITSSFVKIIIWNSSVPKTIQQYSKLNVINSVAIGVSFKIKSGSLFSKLYFINFLNLILKK